MDTARDVATRLELPTDRPRRPESGKPGALEPLSVPAPAADALRELARSRGTSLAQVLLAGYAVMLHRYAGQDGFAIDGPVPAGISLSGNPVFADFVDQAKPLDQPGEASVAFTMSPGSPGGQGERDGQDERVRYDLELEITDGGSGAALAGLLVYDRDLFDAATARRFAGGFVTLVSRAAAEPGRRIGGLPLFEGAPAAGKVTPVPAGVVPAARVDALFAQVAAASPDRVALIDASDGREIRYGELAARARGVAAELTALGVRRGDFVGISLPRSTDLIVAILGVLGAGGAYIPLDPAYPIERLQQMKTSIPPKVIIGRMPADLGAHCIPLPESEAPAGPQIDGSPEDAAYVMFTSGSTGAPKAVVVPHRAIVRLVRGANFADMGPGERWLNAASPAFDASTLELWAPLLNGGTAVVVPGMASVADLGRAIERYQVSAGFITTGLFNVIVDSDVEILRPFRRLLTGGEAGSPDHFRRALRVVPVLTNAYGPTENTTFSCFYPVRDPAEVTSPLPIGTPISGSTMYVADAYQNLLPAGAVGELLAGGDGLATGYGGSPGLTADRFVPSPAGPPGSRLYRTGDFGWIDAEGVVHFAGRRDDQVKVRGFRIELAGIERALADHPLVDQAAVIVYTDPTGDRRLVGYTVGEAGREELIGHLRGRLPEYMIPTQWVRLDEMPLGGTGKVDRRALPEPGADGETEAGPDALAGTAARARTVVEELLIAWYCELLGVADVGPDTDFFTAGGHSLFASRLVARIRTTFAVEMPLAAVFANPRLGDLAAEVAASVHTDLPPIEASGETQRLQLSFAQERMWFMQRFAPDSPQYHVPVTISLRGSLDAAALARALQGLADHNPALRTVFGEAGGRPYQTILPAGTGLTAAEFDLSALDAGLRAEGLNEIAAGLFTAPFDLTSELPIRVALVRMEDRWHELLVVVHHIAVDGWSLPLIWDDLSRAYTGSLPVADEVTYPDFAAWQRAALTGEASAALEAFWRDTLAGAPGRLALPGDVAGEVDTSLGGALAISLPAGAAAGARAVAQQAKATPFAALLAAFGVLIARRTGVEDLVIGTPVASRTQAAVADMVGLFVNTLPVRVDVSGDPSFTELVARVSRSVVAALAHAALPFERIVELAGLPRTTDQQQPLVQVLFAVQPELPRAFRLGNLEAEVSAYYLDAAKVDLTMSLFDDGTALAGFVEYRSCLYSEGFADALTREYGELLGSLTARPDVPVSEAARETVSAGAASPRQEAARPEDEELRDGIASVWEALLGCPVKDGEANFFGLGGHSLTAVQAIAGIRDVLGREVPLREIFEHPTLAAFTARVALAPQAGQRPPLRALPGRQRAPLAPAQLRHWRAGTAEAGTAEVMSLVLRLRGALDVAAVERALTLIATRHAVLRTTFEEGADGPSQRIGPPLRVRVPVTPVNPAGLEETLDEVLARTVGASDAPPWRAELLRLADGDHCLVLTFHQIICDDRTLRVLLGELGAYLADSAPPPAPVRVQYADYAAWQHEFSPASSSWPIAAETAEGGGEHQVALEPRVAIALRKLAADEGTTLSRVVFGLFAAALGHGENRTRVLVGTIEPGRDEAETERMLGCFTSCLVLPCDLTGALTWRDVVRRVRDAVPAAGGADAPELDGLCVIEPAPEVPERLGSAGVTLVRWPEERGGASLELRLREQRDGRLSGVLRFDGGRFDAATAARVASQCAALAGACAAGPDNDAWPATR
jgi:amino acid adenylation domain-containing protein